MLSQKLKLLNTDPNLTGTMLSPQRVEVSVLTIKFFHQVQLNKDLGMAYQGH